MDIQRLQALLQTDLAPAAPKLAANQAHAGTPDFAAALSRALGQVEQAQQAAQEAAVKLVTGEATDIAEVMIASERANLSLGIAVQVRNKLLEAYQDIMRMPL